MRNGIFVSAILIVGYLVTSSASCGSSSAPGTGGSSGSGGSAGTGGSKGTAGSGGSSGSKGSKGSGGTAGSANPCAKDPSKCTAGLTGLSPACETCIATTCSSQFITCEATTGCITAVDCIAACFHKGGLLTECAKTCGEGDASMNLTTVVTDAVLCVAGSCGTTTTCNPSGAMKMDGGGD